MGESLLLRTGEWKVSPLKYRGMGRRKRGEQRWGIKRERETDGGRHCTVLYGSGKETGKEKTNFPESTLHFKRKETRNYL